MAGQGQLDPRNSGRKRRVNLGAVAWTVFVVIATFIGVIQGPKAVVDLHELMCSGSTSWRQFAGRFGDCAAYAQSKSAPQIDVAGGLLKLLPPSAQRKVARDRIAASFSSPAEQDKLYAEGIRIGAEEACYLINFTKIAPDVIPVLERFSSEPIVCSGKEVPAHLLSMDQGCWRDANFGPAGPIALADRWNSARPSPQLRDWAIQKLKAYRFAESAKSNELAQICNKRPGPESEKLSAAERTFIDSVFSFAAACKMERVNTIGLPVNSFIGISQHDQIFGNVPELCRFRAQKVGVDGQAVQIKEYLLRWSKG